MNHPSEASKYMKVVGATHFRLEKADNPSNILLEFLKENDEVIAKALNVDACDLPRIDAQAGELTMSLALHEYKHILNRDGLLLKVHLPKFSREWIDNDSFTTDFKPNKQIWCYGNTFEEAMKNAQKTTLQEKDNALLYSKQPLFPNKYIQDVRKDKPSTRFKTLINAIKFLRYRRKPF